MTPPRDEFLSEEDLDLANLTDQELEAYWNQWLHWAQATNSEDDATYSHGVLMMMREPGKTQVAGLPTLPGPV